jgi:hypothetical protein
MTQDTITELTLVTLCPDQQYFHSLLYQVTEFSFDYTDCLSATNPAGTEVPASTFVHSTPVGSFLKPTYVISPNVTVSVPSQTGGIPFSYGVDRCTVTFNLPVDLQPPVMLYYKLTNFYQNHRKYTKSLDYKQLAGEASSKEEIQKRKGCPLESGELIYPCGLIANSLFNGMCYFFFILLM